MTWIKAFFSRRVFGPFTLFDAVAAAYIFGGAVVSVIWLLMTGCGLVVERLPKPSLVYKVDNVEFFPLCYSRMFVASLEIDGEEAAEKVHYAIDYWNAAIGREVFAWAGRAWFDIDDTQNLAARRLLVVSEATQGEIEERKKLKGLGPENDASIIGGWAQQIVLAGDYVYRTRGDWTNVNTPVDVAHTGDRCAVAGRVWYAMDSPYKEVLSQTTIIHELGHLLGVGHSGADFSVMRPVTSYRNHIAQFLGSDTIDRLRELYPIE